MTVEEKLFYEVFKDMRKSIKNLVGTLDALVEEVRLLRSDQIDSLINEVREFRKSAEACTFGGPH